MSGINVVLDSIQRTNTAHIRKFIQNLTLFLCFPLFLSAFVLGVPFVLGETMDFTTVARLQMGTVPYLYGTAYWQDEFSYKFHATRLRQAKIVILGSSRVMQFRSWMFHANPQSFYNAGGGARSFEQVYMFLSELPDSALPNVLLLGVDQYFFSPGYNYRGARWQNVEKLDTADFNWDLALFNTQRFIEDLLRGRFNLGKLFDGREPVHGLPAIGLNATLNGSGFRNDGSRQYGGLLLGDRTISDALQENLKRLSRGERPFQPGDDFPPERLRQLTEVLSLCRARGVICIGFSAPYSPTFYQAMRDGGRHDYWPKATAPVQALFAQFGWPFFDFTDPERLGLTDDMMIDGFHGSEYVALLMLIAMYREQPAYFAPYADLAHLESIASQAVNYVEIYPDVH